jgi:hypothetical protein
VESSNSCHNGTRHRQTCCAHACRSASVSGTHHHHHHCVHHQSYLIDWCGATWLTARFCEHVCDARVRSHECSYALAPPTKPFSAGVDVRPPRERGIKGLKVQSAEIKQVLGLIFTLCFVLFCSFAVLGSVSSSVSAVAISDSKKKQGLRADVCVSHSCSQKRAKHRCLAPMRLLLGQVKKIHHDETYNPK